MAVVQKDLEFCFIVLGDFRLKRSEASQKGVEFKIQTFLHQNHI
jgi:hypothetical protein